jgi:hypothetical protein
MLDNFPPGAAPRNLRPKPASHSERLWSLLADCAFFSTPSGETFLEPNPAEPGLFIRINHPSCRRFLCQQYSRRFGSTPPPGALRSVVARAHDCARAATLNNFSPTLRVAALSDPSAIGIRHGRSLNHWYISPQGGFTSADQQPSFYAGQGSLPLPQPNPDTPDSALDNFFELLCIPPGPPRLRCLTWLLSAFRPTGPYPILILRGPSGAGKSFAARSLRALTDPNVSPLHPLPSSPEKLRQLAYEHWVLAFDHVTRFPSRTTESLARITENEIHYLPPKRDHSTVSLARPVLLTVTDSCSIPPDIAARSLTVELPPMLDNQRKTEAELQTELDALLPHALARLLKALSSALANCAGQTRTSSLPRLADAAAWLIAAAPALGLSQEEILQTLSTPLDPLVRRVAALMQNRETWNGSATQLAADLNLDLEPSQLSRQLFQNQEALNSLGLTATRCRGRLTRSIQIIRLDQNLENAVTPSPPNDSREAASDPQSPAPSPGLRPPIAGP